MMTRKKGMRIIEVRLKVFVKLLFEKYIVFFKPYYLCRPRKGAQCIERSGFRCAKSGFIRIVAIFSNKRSRKKLDRVIEHMYTKNI